MNVARIAAVKAARIADAAQNAAAEAKTADAMRA